MLIFLLILFNALILFAQLILALWFKRKQIMTVNSCNTLLSSGQTGADTIAAYCRIFKQINLTVDAPIYKVAQAIDRHLLVNKQLIYSRDLYTNIVIVWELLLTRRKYAGLRGNRLQQFFLLVQVLLLLAGFIHEFVMIFSLIIGIGLLNSGFYRQNGTRYLQKQCDEVATDILNLNDYEQGLSSQLVKSQSWQYHLYAIDLLVNIKNFVVPR